MKSFLLVPLLLLGAVASAQELRDQVTHGFAENGEVKLHYAALGDGPLVLMIHGFPDFWYSWRHQMPELAKTHKVVAYDQRGYNESSKPEGQEQYDLSLLVADAAAVITHFGVDKAVVVGHDWGGVVAWSLAAMRPELVEKLVILNLPHPKCLARELATNPEQQKNAAYARAFQVAGAEKMLSSFFLAGIAVPNDAEARPAYIEAFDKSDFTAMLHYYRQNYPREPYTLEAAPPLPNIQAPVLQFHGLKDTALHANGLNGTWEYLDNAWTLVTVPDAGHWVQHDAAALVTKTIVDWLGK